MLAGAYEGFIVGKTFGDLHRPGGAYTIERWMATYKLGLLGGPYDLVITKIRNKLATKEYLQKLHLTYYKPELENGTTWKIPRHFKSKMIDERLSTLPCIFRNQNFTFNYELFIEIRNSKAFEYELVKTENVLPDETGEKIE